MRSIFLILAISVACFQYSCNNTVKTNEDAGKTDSIRRADSIQNENAYRTEREEYRHYLQKKIDSLDTRIAHNDSIYDTRIQKDHEKWLKNRERLKERIKSLRQRKDDAGTVAKDDWNKFKLNVDTAFTNLKSDWNNMLENMKSK